MKVNTSALVGRALDYAVMLCTGQWLGVTHEIETA